MCEEGEGEEGEAGQDRAARHHRPGEHRFIAAIVGLQTFCQEDILSDVF